MTDESKRHTAHYSIIYYCPDPGRQEFVNVGLVLFDGDRGKAVVDPSEERLKRFFPALDIEFAGAAIKSKCVEIEREWRDGNYRTPETFRRWKTTWGGAVKCSDVRPCSVTDFDADFARMLKELVEEAK